MPMLMFIALFACNGPDDTDVEDTDVEDTDDTDDTDVAGYPLDDVLRMHHVQQKGTHNSYHVARDGASDSLDYTHAPIPDQLASQDVRHVEFDVDRDGEGVYRVRHIYIVDDLTTCDTLPVCLGHVATWSRANPGHAPIVVMIEVKQAYNADTAPAFLDGLEDIVSAAFPEDQRITPDMVQGDAASLSAAVAADGWPTLAESRGRVLTVLFDIGGQFRPHYTDGDTTTAGRLMFPIGQGELDNPVIAMHWLDDARAQGDDIAAALAENHLVRTRADADNVEPYAADTSRAEAALASGAQLISTDYPVAVDGVDYVFDLPEGGPVRCSPVTAPAACTTLAIEDPALLQ